MRTIRAIFTTGTRLPLIAVAVTACLAAGAAAAAAGGPLLGSDRPSPPTVAPTTVAPPSTVTTTGATATREPASTEPAATQPPAAVAPAVEPPAPAPSSPPTTETPTTATVPEPTQAASPPVTEAPAGEVPGTEAPATSRPDTVVPEGIHLECVATGADVTCQWSGGVVDGFAKFLLLRGAGGARGRVPFMTADSSANGYIDHGVPPGSYSYVLVTVDVNSHALVHSNPVFITIGAAG